jgi:hypothetical protein
VKFKRKYLYALAALGVGGLVIYLLRRSSTPAPPAVPGTLSSGSASTTIDTNVLSPGFGLPIVNQTGDQS